LYAVLFPETIIIGSCPCALEGVARTSDKSDEMHIAIAKTFFAGKSQPPVAFINGYL
jgi:hypothetical protein